MHHLHELIATHGCAIVMLLVALEGAGIPAPGETALISAAIYASRTHQLDIVHVIVSAGAGAVLGDNIGYWIGRWLGTHVLLRHGRRIGLTEPRLKVGHYLFMRYGGAVVTVARFVAVLRTVVPLLAGASLMPWRRFVLFDLCGSASWALGFGSAAYLVGHEVHRLHGPIAAVIAALVVGGLTIGVVQLRRHHRRLQEEAERAFPGPLGQHAP
jgi:membrane protein DedA with SNARE-associated domain